MSAVAPRRSATILACFLAAAVLFFFANRGAYKGFFSDDDLDNLTWPTFVSNSVYLQGLATLKFDGKNFRPIGDLYYRYLFRASHLNFPPYVAALQLIHALNVILLFLILRHLNLSRIAAVAGTLFYSFHAAVLEIYWKPMYVFDLLCATFCLLAFLLYVRGRWILGFLAFWLAFKSKEIALMLPVVLLAWEWLFGKREWKRLIPYLAISMVVGAQVLWLNKNIDPANPYALHFGPEMLWRSTAFYSSQIFFSAFAGLALLLLPIWIHDRVLYLGLISMAATIAPLLAMNQRLDSAYWYVPMIGIALVIASIAARTPRWAIALLFAIWLSLNFAILREKRRAILAEADRDRVLLASVREYARRIPPVHAIVFENMPDQIQWFGVHGAISLAFGPQVESAWSHTPESKELFPKTPMAVIRFRSGRSIQGLVRSRNGAEPYVRFADLVPEGQFGAGWQEQDADSRWIQHRAECVLYRSPQTTDFEIVAKLSDRSAITVIEDGRTLGTVTSAPGFQTLRWKLTAGDAGEKRISIIADGIAVEALGYIRH